MISNAVNAAVSRCPLCPRKRHVRCSHACLLSANSRHHPPYSITSSACASSVCGTVIPSALAVLRSITVSYGWGRPQCFSDKYFFSVMAVRCIHQVGTIAGKCSSMSLRYCGRWGYRSTQHAQVADERDPARGPSNGRCRDKAPSVARCSFLDTGIAKPKPPRLRPCPASPETPDRRTGHRLHVFLARGRRGVQLGRRVSSDFAARGHHRREHWDELRLPATKEQ